MKYLLFAVTSLMLLPSLNAKICPLENHYVCNKDVSRHSCVCALIKSEEPAPEKSCNLVANIVNNEFEASSITFNLDDSSEQFNTFPEVAFKKEIASALKVKVSDIVIVRLRCTDSDKKLTIQFLILKENNTVMQINVSTLKTILSKKKGLKSLPKVATEEEDDDDKSEKKESNDSKDESDEDDDGNVEKTEENDDDSNKDDSVEDDKDADKDDSSNEKENSKDDDDEKDDDDSEKSNDNDDSDDDDESKEVVLYEQNDFIDSDIIVKKMKTMGHLSQIAELDVDEIQVVKNLFDIENDTGNFILFVQAVFLIVAVIMTCVCGCYMSCRKSEYSDDLQKV